MTSIEGRTVGELVAERPALSRVFEEYGIDYCCGGKVDIATACEQRGLDAAEVRAAVIAVVAAEREPAASDDWRRAPLDALCRHIVGCHHGFLRRELPRLGSLVEKVEKAHGAAHAELHEVRRVFEGLAEELAEHTEIEERVLFPACAVLQAGEPTGFGTLAIPIAAMEHDHELAGDALARLRELTGGYRPPEDACNSYRAMLDGLAELERDMHVHVNLENHVLFPRALALEAALG